jgi:hypothetical protein
VPQVPVLHLGILTLLFSCSCCARRNHSSGPIAIHPSILPIPCILLNLSVLACYSFPCLFTLSLEVPRSSLARPACPPLWASRALSFFPLAHSRHSTPLLSTASGLFCAMGARNPLPLNRLRTLSIAMGVYTPLFPFSTLSRCARTKELRGRNGTHGARDMQKNWYKSGGYKIAKSRV